MTLLLRDTNPWHEWSQTVIALEEAAMRQSERPTPILSAGEAARFTFYQLCRYYGMSVTAIPAMIDALTIVRRKKILNISIISRFVDRRAIAAALADAWGRE